MNSLEILENKTAKLLLDAPSLSSSTEVLIRRQKHWSIFIFKYYNGWEILTLN